MFDRIKKTVRGWFPGGAYGPPPWWSLSSNSSKVTVSEHNAPNLAPVFRALTLITSDIARAGRKVRLPNGDFTEEHPLLDLLDEPFRFISSHDWFRQIVWITIQHGNAGVVIVRDGRGDPIELAPLVGGALSLQVSGDDVSYQVANEAGRVIPEDILHFKTASPGSNWLWGASPFALCTDALTCLAQQQVAAEQMSVNLGTPRLVLKHPGTLSGVAVQNLKDSYSRTIAGANNAGTPLVLQEGMNAETIEPKAGQEFASSRLYSLADVSRMTGVPASMLGDGSDTRYTGLSEQVSGYVAQCLQIWGGIIASELSKKLLPPGERLVFDYSNVKAGSPADVTNTMVAAVNAGLVTKDEARARMGYGPLPEEAKPAPTPAQPLQDPTDGTPNPSSVDDLAE